MKRMLLKIWPWKTIHELETKVDKLLGELELERFAHKMTHVKHEEVLADVELYKAKAETTQQHLRKMTNIIALKGGIILSMLMCVIGTAQPLIRGNLDTNAVGVAPGDGWLLGSLTSVPIWQFNSLWFTNNDTVVSNALFLLIQSTGNNGTNNDTLVSNGLMAQLVWTNNPNVGITPISTTNPIVSAIGGLTATGTITAGLNFSGVYSNTAGISNTTGGTLSAPWAQIDLTFKRLHSTSWSTMEYQTTNIPGLWLASQRGASHGCLYLALDSVKNAAGPTIITPVGCLSNMFTEDSILMGTMPGYKYLSNVVVKFYDSTMIASDGLPNCTNTLSSSIAGGWDVADSFQILDQSVLQGGSVYQAPGPLIGESVTAIGYLAGSGINGILNSGVTNNVLIGAFARDAGGNSNTIVGAYSGSNLGGGSKVVLIDNLGVSSDTNVVRIGDTQSSSYLAGIIVSSNGIADYLSVATAPTSIVFPATTVNWTNTQAYNIVLYVDNTAITGTAIKKNGTTVFTSLTGDCTLLLKPGDYFSETYTVGTPAAKWEPQ